MSGLMPYRAHSRIITAPDGTRVAYHTHGTTALENASPELASRPAVLLTNGIGTTENFWRFLVADLGTTGARAAASARPAGTTRCASRWTTWSASPSR